MGKAQQSTLRGKEGLRDVVSSRHAGYGRSCLPPIGREHITFPGQPTCNTLLLWLPDRFPLTGPPRPGPGPAAAARATTRIH
jgi:hypothetical protein